MKQSIANQIEQEEGRVVDMSRHDEDINSQSYGRNDREVDVFGFKLKNLPPQVAGTINMAINTFMPDFRRGGEKYMAKAATYAAQSLLHKDAATAKKFGDVAADIAGYSVILAAPVAGVATSFKHSAKKLAQVRKDIAVYQNGNRNRLGLISMMTSNYSGNEVVAAAVDRELRGLYTNLGTDAIQLAVGSGVQLGIKIKDQMAKNAQLRGAREEESLSTEERVNKAAKGGAAQAKGGFEESHQNWEAISEKHPEWSDKERKRAEERYWQLCEQEASEAKIDPAMDQKIRDFMERAGGGALQGLSDYLKDRFRNGQKAKVGGTIALDLITKLEKELADDPELSNVGGVSLPAFIMAIFEKHEECMGRKLPRSLKEKLQENAALIAKDLKRGDIHPQALIELVGSRLVYTKAQHVIAPEEMRKLLDGMALKNATYHPVDMKTVLEETELTTQQLAAPLKHLKGDALAIYASFMPAEVLKAAGKSAQEIERIQNDAYRHYGRIMTDAVEEIFHMDKRQLHALGLTEDMIHELGMIKKEFKHAKHGGIEDAVGTPLRETPLKSILRKAVVADGGSWVEHVVDKSLADKEHSGSHHRHLSQGDVDGMEAYRPHHYEDGMEGRHAARTHAKYRPEEGHASRFEGEDGFTGRYQKSEHGNEWGMRN